MVTSRSVALISALLLFSTALSAPAFAAKDRDILWNIVTTCLDPGAPDYSATCRWPIVTSAAACRKTTDVWDISSDYVTLRDIKMCDCLDDSSFVHGLVMPRKKVTGSEDPNRPAGIWQFAWNSAMKRIDKEEEIALVVNAPGEYRRQDQLHIHIVRANSPAVEKLAEGSRMAVVKDIADVWKEAKQAAKKSVLDSYGVLVVKNAAGGFKVFVENSNMESEYTRAKCSKKSR